MEEKDVLEVDEEMKAWNEEVKVAEEMVAIIGSLYRSHHMSIILFGLPLLHIGPTEIIMRHNRAIRLLESSSGAFRCNDTIAYLKAAPSRASILVRAQDVVLYGFGRIGRLLARILIRQTAGGNNLRLRAVVLRKGGLGTLRLRASLLRRDSVHGKFIGEIVVDEENHCLICNGNCVYFLEANTPTELDYTKYGIKDAIVMDNTGKWRDFPTLSQHLESKGVKKVLVTAPASKPVPNIVFGVNHASVDPNTQIYSAASCTTNAVVPVLMGIDERYGVEHCVLQSVHAYTNDQNLMDNVHKHGRRGRAAALNMVITATGAAKAVGLALPNLEGKVVGKAIRVPTPDVSLAILMLDLAKETTTEELNDYLRTLALDSPLQDQIDFVVSNSVVSSDLVGSDAASVVDAVNTEVNGKKAIVYVWYDNEAGYAAQVIRLVEWISGLWLATIPQPPETIEEIEEDSRPWSLGTGDGTDSLTHEKKPTMRGGLPTAPPQ